MSDDTDQNLDQSEIEKLLQQGGGGGGEDQSADEGQPADSGDSDADSGNLNENLGQDEVEKLLQQAQGGQQGAQQQQSQPETSATSQQKTDASRPQTGAGGQSHADADVQLLINQAEEALRSVDEPQNSDVAGLTPFELQPLSGAPANVDQASLDLLRDVELEMRIELGRTHMYLEDVLQLRKGSVVPLDKMAGDPVDVYVNGRLVARGEVLVLNENFCVRIAELISGEEVGQRESA